MNYGSDVCSTGFCLVAKLTEEPVHTRNCRSAFPAIRTCATSGNLVTIQLCLQRGCQLIWWVIAVSLSYRVTHHGRHSTCLASPRGSQVSWLLTWLQTPRWARCSAMGSPQHPLLFAATFSVLQTSGCTFPCSTSHEVDVRSRLPH